MDLTDLSEFLTVPTLTLAVRKKKYEVKSANAATWLRLQQISLSTAKSESTPESVSDLFKMALGPVYDELLAADVTRAELEHVGMTAYFWQLGLEEAAAAYWRSGGKAPAPVKSPRRTTPRATRPAAASSTRRRASGTGTTGRK